MPAIRQTEQFVEWLDALRDRQAKLRIAVRVERLAEGNPGQQRVLTGGATELKIDVGPGYRGYTRNVAPS